MKEDLTVIFVIFKYFKSRYFYNSFVIMWFVIFICNVNFIEIIYYILLICYIDKFLYLYCIIVIVR